MTLSDFAIGLAKGRIPKLVIPTDEYLHFDGDIISFFHQWAVRYYQQVEQIEDIAEASQQVQEFFHSYNESITHDFDLLRELKKVSNALIDCLTYSFKGFPHEAYTKLYECLVEDDRHLLMLLPQLEIQPLNGFRVRKGRYENVEDLLHVPFESRHKCGNYRFSISGSPSLYLANSLETAMREIRAEKDADYTVCRFKNHRRLLFYDLALTPAIELMWEFYSLVLFYPLIVICSLKVKEADAKFFPEYVVPQILYQLSRWDGQAEIVGISYSSTRYDNIDLADTHHRNFAIFIRDADKEKGFSDKIVEMFEVTRPYTFTYTDDTDFHLEEVNLYGLRTNNIQ